MMCTHWDCTHWKEEGEKNLINYVANMNGYCNFLELPGRGGGKGEDGGLDPI